MKWTTSGNILDANHDCSIGFGKSVGGIAQSLAFTRKIGNRRGSEALRSFKNSNGTNLLILIVLTGDIEMNPGPRFQCRLCKNTVRQVHVVECAVCEQRFHASCTNLGMEDCKNWNLVVNLGIVRTARLSVDPWLVITAQFL